MKKSASIAKTVTNFIPVLLTEKNIEATVDEMICMGAELITENDTWFDWATKLSLNLNFSFMPYLVVKQVYQMLKSAQEVNDLITMMKGGN